MKSKTIAGFNVTCVGDDRAYSYLPSHNGRTLSDLMAKHVLKWIDKNYITYGWLDEVVRDNMLVLICNCINIKTKYGMYPEYHTSLDDLKKYLNSQRPKWRLLGDL